jgi:DNA-binding MarR family transcriptional regulator
MKSDLPTIDFERSLGPWIGRTSKVTDYYLQEAMQRYELDLTKEQMVVLKKLHDQDGLNQNELAQLIYRDKSSLARLLSKMEQKKYIIRKQHPQDKRVNEVFLTVGGKTIFQKSRAAIQEVITIMEQDISQEEKNIVIEILKKVQENFTNAPIAQH